MLAHWLLYHLGLQEARTQTTSQERRALAEFAAGASCVVEVGVFEGVTSRILRRAMAPNGVLYCIDPFPTGRIGFSYGLSITNRELRKESNASCRILRNRSLAVAAEWHEPIDLIFIDADHEYAAVRADWNAWKAHVKPGGWIGFHDSQIVGVDPAMGPVQVVREIVSVEPDYSVATVVDSLTVLRRGA